MASRPSLPAPVPPPSSADLAIDLKSPSLYINRELSWLSFNERVLDQVRDPSHPLLERVKFLAIAGANLDEFFMIRVAGTLKKLREGLDAGGPDGLTMTEQVAAMRRGAYAQLREQASCWEALRPLLAEHDIRFLEPADWSPEVHAFLASHFGLQIAPVLTPLAFDPGHPFPLISNLSNNFAVVVRHEGRTQFARVKIPNVLPRFIALPAALASHTGTTFVFLEDVIRRNIQDLFPGTLVEGAHLFRVIRDTDMVIQEDEADDLLETVDRGLKQLRYEDLYAPLVTALKSRRSEIASKATEVFEGREVARTAVDSLADDFESTVRDWHEQVKRLHREFQEFTERNPIAPGRGTLVGPILGAGGVTGAKSFHGPSRTAWSCTPK